MYRVWNFLTNYSLLLIFGAIIALIWANTNPHSYHHLVEYPLWFNDWLGPSYKYWAKAYGNGYDTFASGGASNVLSFLYLVNDIGMAFFFITFNTLYVITISNIELYHSLYIFIAHIL